MTRRFSPWTAEPAKSLWWLSYAGDGDEVKVVIVEGISFFDAVSEARRQKLSPGGQVRGFEVPAEEEETFRLYRGRCLTEAEALALGGRREESES